VATGDPVTDRPILFRTDMVRAILSGAKTQTRRPLRAPADDVTVGRFNPTITRRGIEHPGPELFGAHGDGWHVVAPCAPGDRLWVREAFRLYDVTDVIRVDRESRGCQLRFSPGGDRVATFQADGAEGPFRPSIHMPRWASRLTLAVRGVRAERVEGIGEADARAEGFQDRGAFLRAWADIYETEAWAWVIDFERCA